MTQTKVPFTGAAKKAKKQAYRNSGERPVSDITLIVLHDTEGPVGPGAATEIANYFASTSAGGSAHLVIDDDEAIRCLPDNMIPWGAPGANTNGFHIEQCGYASWTKAQWLHHHDMLERVAVKVAQHCKSFGIPCKFVYHTGLGAGAHGVTTHAEVSKWAAIYDPSLEHDHTDPGEGYPIGYVMALAQQYLAELKADAGK